MTTETKKQDDFNFQTAHRASHCNIETPKPFMKNGKAQGDPKFSALFIIDPENTDLKHLKEEVTAMLTMPTIGIHMQRWQSGFRRPFAPAA